MSLEKLNVAMVGVGGFGAYRRDRMRETGLFNLISAYDRNAEVLADACAKEGCRAASSYEELLEMKGIKAVIISTGAKFHTEQAAAAMERGFHVFIEKPLCSTPAELDMLIGMQKTTSVVAAVGHNDLHGDPKCREVKRMIDDGELGAIACVECATAHSGGLEIRPGDWRGDPARNPGGMLFQCGVHSLHELMFYFGPVRRVFCSMRYDVRPEVATADAAQCVLEFESGLIGTLGAYYVTPVHSMINILGTKRALFLEDRYLEPGRYEMQNRGCNVPEPRLPITFGTEQKDPASNLRSFYKAIMEGGTPYPSLLDGARPVAVVFAADESSRSGRMEVVRSL